MIQSLLTYLFTHVLPASFPSYFAKNPSETFVSLVNTQSIACGFGVIWRKDPLAEQVQLAQYAHAEIRQQALKAQNKKSVTYQGDAFLFDMHDNNFLIDWKDNYIH